MPTGKSKTTRSNPWACSEETGPWSPSPGEDEVVAGGVGGRGKEHERVGVEVEDGDGDGGDDEGHRSSRSDENDGVPDGDSLVTPGEWEWGRARESDLAASRIGLFGRWGGCGCGLSKAREKASSVRCRRGCGDQCDQIFLLQNRNNNRNKLLQVAKSFSEIATLSLHFITFLLRSVSKIKLFSPQKNCRQDYFFRKNLPM